MYRLDFPYIDKEGSRIKFALCLQSGALVAERRNRFVGALLTTKNLEKRYPWEVFVSAAESRTPEGARISLAEPQIIMKEWVIEHAYDLRAETMREVDKAILVSLSIALP